MHTEREPEHDLCMRVLQTHFRVAYEKAEILWPKTALVCRRHRLDTQPLEGGRKCKARLRRRAEQAARDLFNESDEEGEEGQDWEPSEDDGEGEEDEPSEDDF